MSLFILDDTAISLAAQRGITTTRVRSEHALIVAAIANAAEHSPTFRGLLEAVEKTDGIVYVTGDSCRRGLQACLVTVRSAPPVRFVFITVDMRKAVGCELLSSIGHELQHVLEVLANPKIVNHDTLTHFYMRRGATGDEARFETESAVRTGLLVEKEVRASSNCRP